MSENKVREMRERNENYYEKKELKYQLYLENKVREMRERNKNYYESKK